MEWPPPKSIGNCVGMPGSWRVANTAWSAPNGAGAEMAGADPTRLADRCVGPATPKSNRSEVTSVDHTDACRIRSRLDNGWPETSRAEGITLLICDLPRETQNREPTRGR